MDEPPLDAETYRRLLFTHYDYHRLYTVDALVDWLQEQGWSHRTEDLDRTGRDCSIHVVSKRSTLIRGIGAEALLEIAEVEDMSMKAVQIRVIEHQGGPEWPEPALREAHREES